MHLTEPWLRASVTFLGKKGIRIRPKGGKWVDAFPSCISLWRCFVRFAAIAHGAPLFRNSGTDLREEEISASSIRGLWRREGSWEFDMFRLFLKLQDILRLFRSDLTPNRPWEIAQKGLWRLFIWHPTLLQAPYLPRQWKSLALQPTTTAGCQRSQRTRGLHTRSRRLVK